MSFDCQYKIKEGFCRKLKKECSPGEKGCILYGKYDFPLKEKSSPPKKQSSEIEHL
jgi:hypothetical protein